MANVGFLSEREELRGIALAARLPGSAEKLQHLIEKVKARTIQAVVKDPKVEERLQGRRFAVVGAEIREEKPSGAAALAPRLAEVGIYDYDRNVLVIAVVDVRAGAVVDIEERSGIQPALTKDEEQDGRKIVLSNPQFQSLKKRPRLELVTLPARVAFSESHPCYRHRCFEFYFWSTGKQPQKVAQMIVDLSTRQVVPGSPEDFPSA